VESEGSARYGWSIDGKDKKKGAFGHWDTVSRRRWEGLEDAGSFGSQEMTNNENGRIVDH
jgi:hypothetical protein